MNILEKITNTTNNEDDFICGSFRAKNVYRKETEINVYELYSYNTLIAFSVDTGNEKVWFLNKGKYSTTTTKHRNAISQKVFNHIFDNEEDIIDAHINPLPYLLSKQLKTSEIRQKRMKI